MSSVIGNHKCPCGGSCTVTEGKGGMLNSRCGQCGAQTMVKSPRGVALWLDALKVTKPAAPAPTDKSKKDEAPPAPTKRGGLDALLGLE